MWRRCVSSVSQPSFPHSQVICTCPRGVGANHTWYFTVGGQTSLPAIKPTSYNPPSITTLIVQGNGELRTAGASTVAIEGTELGWGGNGVAITASYGPTASEFVVPCTLSLNSNSSLLCVAAPGMGAGFPWRVDVAGQLSGVSTNVTSYTVPALLPERAVTGPGAVNGSTAGGQVVQLFATSIGPAVLPAGVFAQYIVSYGRTAQVCGWLVGQGDGWAVGGVAYKLIDEPWVAWRTG